MAAVIPPLRGETFCIAASPGGAPSICFPRRGRYASRAVPDIDAAAVSITFTQLSCEMALIA